MLKNYKYVYAVYEKQSFSKAAEALHLSQPALSMAIKKLETELGLQLFDRSSNPVSLTEAGQRYMEAAERVLSIERELVRDLSRLRKEKSRSIHVGSSAYFCTYVLKGLAEGFQAIYPETRIELQEVNSGEFSGLFEAKQLDMGLTVDRLEEMQGGLELSCVVWKQEEIILAVPANMPAARTQSSRQLSYEHIHNSNALKNAPTVELSAFQETPFLFLKPGNDLHDRAEAMCRNAGFTPQIAMHLDQLLTSYYVACSGQGAAFIRADLLRFAQASENLSFFKLSDPLASRDIRLYFDEKLLTSVGWDFVRFLRSHADTAG